MARDDNPQDTHPDLWLDDDHFIEFRTIPGETEPCGGIFWHRRTSSHSGWCCGDFAWRRPAQHVRTPKGTIFADGETWQLISRDPLTLSPSFLCHCGHHGWIREGRWVPA